MSRSRLAHHLTLLQDATVCARPAMRGITPTVALWSGAPTAPADDQVRCRAGILVRPRNIRGFQANGHVAPLFTSKSTPTKRDQELGALVTEDMLRDTYRDRGFSRLQSSSWQTSESYTAGLRATLVPFAQHHSDAKPRALVPLPTERAARCCGMRPFRS